MTTVLHLTWGLEMGGKEGFLDNLVRGMDAGRFTNHVWTLRKEGVFFDRLKRDNYRVTCLGKRPGVDPRLMARLRRGILDLKPDVVHAHDFTSTLAVSGVLLSKGRPPVIATLHGGYLGLTPVKQRVCEFLLRRTVAVTAVSQHLTTVIRRRLGDAVPVRHVPYDVDAGRFAPTAEAKGMVRQWGLADDDPVVVMVARLELPKDQASLIRAAQRICSQMPACHFLLAGDGSRRQALTALAARLGLRDRVHFLGNRLDVSDIVKLADVCVLASGQEGLSRAIQEYMAAGKPVVATDVGGGRELIHDGEEGFLVGMEDVEALAEKILYLLRQPEAARMMGQKGQDVVRSRFARGDMFRAYESLYEWAAGWSGPKGGRGGNVPP